MARPLPLLLAAALVVALALPAAAQNRVTATYKCPVCGATVEAERQVSANALGGTDSDFCQYGKGGQVREVAVVTCPTCYYSHLHDRFERVLTESERAAVEEALNTVGPTYANIEAIPIWDRYQIASLVAGRLGESSFLQGDLLLTGAWTARDRVVGFLPMLGGPVEAMVELEVMEAEWRKVPDLQTQQMALFDLMRVAHRGGFPARRDGYLAQVDELQPVPEEILQVRAKVRDWIETEEHYLASAKAKFEEGLAVKEGSAEDQVYYQYLVIDLKRRLGQTEGLRAELDQMLTDPGLPAQLKEAARGLVEVLKERPGK